MTKDDKRRARDARERRYNTYDMFGTRTDGTRYRSPEQQRKQGCALGEPRFLRRHESKYIPHDGPVFEHEEGVTCRVPVADLHKGKPPRASLL